MARSAKSAGSDDFRELIETLGPSNFEPEDTRGLTELLAEAMADANAEYRHADAGAIQALEVRLGDLRRSIGAVQSIATGPLADALAALTAAL